MNVCKTYALIVYNAIIHPFISHSVNFFYNLKQSKSSFKLAYAAHAHIRMMRQCVACASNKIQSTSNNNEIKLDRYLTDISRISRAPAVRVAYF